ncbi:MAG: DUF2752 domain-containing protein [Thermoanaerobaculaceae bacterium]|nr:DUF2752 domain-containing protein [Thermoanaerobaculaceae bacterium]
MLLSAAALVAAALLPVGLLDQGPVLCPVRLLGGDWCWGCGITRACWHLLHGDLAGALAHNRLVVLVAPLLLFLYLRWAVRNLHPPAQGRGERGEERGPATRGGGQWAP